LPVIAKAFKAPKVKAVALNIDHPGGQAFESERGGQTIQRRSRKTGLRSYRKHRRIGRLLISAAR